MAGDCDDTDASAYPGGPETPYDGVDQDCDGQDLDDLDADGYGQTEDCDDADADVHPEAEEVWGNAFHDNDCDGQLEQAAPAVFGDRLWYSSDAGAAVGSSLAAYVDLDADGLPEILTSAPGKDTFGEGYLVSGASLGEGDLRLPEGASHVFSGSDAFTYWGSDIAFLGDIDGDGVEEVAMSASFATADGVSTAGRIAVFSLSESVHVKADADYLWSGYYEGGRFGETIASVGDVDGDGLPDTLVSAEQGDIFVVLPATSGTVVDVALSRVTRDGDTERYRTVPVDNLDGTEGDDVAVLGAEVAYIVTGLGTFTVQTQSEAWMTIRASDGSQFSDAVPLGDQTGDGVPETLFTRTWSADDATAWAGVLLGDDLGWRVEIDAEALELTALGSRAQASHGYRATYLPGEPGVLVFGGPTDDRGAEGAGSVALLALPE